MRITEREIIIPVEDYDLAGTLSSGQAFRWIEENGAWTGVIGKHWVRLHSSSNGITAEVAEPVTDWNWLTDYLQVHLDLKTVLSSFPVDEAMQKAVCACHGLRLLKQDPWECLASFILSSTKQIVQIQQIVKLLCERFGEPIAVPDRCETVYAFPSAARLASVSETELRECKMGFRAPYLQGTAQMILRGEVNLERLYEMNVEGARAELLKFPGVGRKIADCVLLFAYNFQSAFPVDVWVMKALRQLYFPKRRPSASRLLNFTQSYFGLNAGYAQQYLFHFMRTKQIIKNST